MIQEKDFFSIDVWFSNITKSAKLLARLSIVGKRGMPEELFNG
jgi:hypothetical protein